MVANSRKVVVIIFVVISIVLVASTAYTAQIYFGAYRAIRTFNVTLKSLDAKVFNATYGEITTILTFSNPSEYSFHVEEVKQVLYLQHNGKWEYFWSRLVKHPSAIAPHLTTNVSFTLTIPEQKMQLISETDQKEWYIEMHVRLSGTMLKRTELVFEMIQS